MVFLHEKESALVSVLLVENGPRLGQHHLRTFAFVLVDLFVEAGVAEPHCVDVSQFLAEDRSQLAMALVDVAVDLRCSSSLKHVPQSAYLRSHRQSLRNESMVTRPVCAFENLIKAVGNSLNNKWDR